jgi:hypothetical protein
VTVGTRLGLGRPAQPGLEALLQLDELERGEELCQRRTGTDRIGAAQALQSGQTDLCILELHASDVLDEPGVEARRGSPVAGRLGAQQHQADGKGIDERDRRQLSRRRANQNWIARRQSTAESGVRRALRCHEHMFACDGRWT